MPKIKKSLKSKLQKIVNEFKGLKTDGDTLICTICDKVLTFDHKHGTDRVKTHFQSQQHIKATALKNSKNPQQEFISVLLKNSQNIDTLDIFNLELTKTFVECDIPLSKLEKSSLKCFLEKYIKRTIVSQTTLRNKYVPNIYNAMLEDVKKMVCDKN